MNAKIAYSHANALNITLLTLYVMWIPAVGRVQQKAMLYTSDYKSTAVFLKWNLEKLQTSWNEHCTRAQTLLNVVFPLALNQTKFYFAPLMVKVNCERTYIFYPLFIDQAFSFYSLMCEIVLVWIFRILFYLSPCVSCTIKAKQAVCSETWHWNTPALLPGFLCSANISETIGLKLPQNN